MRANESVQKEKQSTNKSHLKVNKVSAGRKPVHTPAKRAAQDQKNK